MTRRPPWTSDLSASQDIPTTTYIPAIRRPLPGDPVAPGPLLARLRGQALNVRDLGAAGDGITDDTGALQDAFSSGATNLLIPPGNYYVASTLTLPSTCHLWGSGPDSILWYYGTGPCISMHGTTPAPPGFGTVTDGMFGGAIRDLFIDGSNAQLTGGGAGAAGLEIGDAWGYNLDRVFLVHFNQGTSGSGLTNGSAGLHGLNSVFWTEKCHLDVHCFDCTTSAVFEQGAGQPSFEYNDIVLHVLCHEGQDGLCVQNGGYMAGGSLTMRGNFNTSNSVLTNAMIRIQGTGSENSHIQHVEFDVVVESNNSHTYGPISFAFGSSANSSHDNHGLISLQDVPWTAAQSAGGALNTGQFTFRGTLKGDPTLNAVTAPAFPGSTNTITNNQNDAMAYIAANGASITQIQVNGVTIGVTAGPVFLPSGATFEATYTGGPPTWVWVSCI